MNREEMIDKAVRGLAGQGWAKSRRERLCAFRGFGGLKCSVGHLVTDEQIKEAIRPEDCYYPEPSTDDLCNVAGLDIKDAIKLQGCHDGSRDPEEMRSNFIRLAKEWNVPWPEGL